MAEISVAEAEGKLADLVERVRQGETSEVTDGGQTVARLVGAAPKWSRSTSSGFARSRPRCRSIRRR